MVVFRNYRSYYPKQFAAYLQDRIEIGDLVVRAGLRFEYYDAARLSSK